MGNSDSKIVEVIRDPVSDEALRKLFNQFDKDKNGSLDKEEWKLFGKYLWLADVKEATEEVKKEVRHLSPKTHPNIAWPLSKPGSLAASDAFISMNESLFPFHLCRREGIISSP